MKVPDNSMHNGENLRNIIYELQEEEVEEVIQGKEARRSSRARTKSVILTNYEIFFYQLVDGHGDLIEAIMLEYEPIDLNQALKGYNQKEAIKDELNVIEKNQSWEFVSHSSKKTIDVK